MPPETTILRARIKPRWGFARFFVQSSELGSSFWCKLDGRRAFQCGSPQTYRRLRPGRYVFRVSAMDPSGNVDLSPAVFRFRVKLRVSNEAKPKRRQGASAVKVRRSSRP